VKDLAGSIPLLASAGYEPVDVNLAHANWQEAFLHPRDTPGVLIQLAQVVEPERYEPPRTLEAFLADHVDLRA
jgi:hypothetical protein